jgi:hypothetical protein
MLQQNKLILILILIILSLSLVIGLVFLSPFKNIFIKQPVTQQELVKQRLADVKKYDLALAQTDANLCKKIADLPTRDLCYEKVAAKAQDTAVCQNINNEIDKNRCIYVIIKGKAIIAKSIEPCNELINQPEINKCKSQVQASNFCPDEECLDALKQ